MSLETNPGAICNVSAERAKELNIDTPEGALSYLNNEQLASLALRLTSEIYSREEELAIVKKVLESRGTSLQNETETKDA